MKRRRTAPRGASQKSYWVAAGLAIFVLSRLIISMGYGVYISDLIVFHYSASQSLVEGTRAYLNYFFPYPPLALALTTWPIHLSTDFTAYRGLFHLSFFVLEIFLVVVALRVGRTTLGLTPRYLFGFLLIYAGLGFLQGHLLYDRLDLAITLSLLVSAAAFPPYARLKTWLAWNGGFLVKIMPILWAPFTSLLREAQQESAPALRHTLRAALRTAIVFLPSLAVLLIYGGWSQGALWHSLGDHGERTIQIESTWASLLFLVREVFPSFSLFLITKWGAQHIAPESIPPVIDFLSRYFGWMLWLGGLAWIAFRGLRRLRDFSTERLGVFHFYLLTTAVVGFMATQRVLSPQYFIWVMAPLALIVAHRRSWRWALGVVLLYGLTWIGFDLHYGDLVNQRPLAIYIVAARNGVLVTVWLALCGDLRRQWREALS